MDTKYTCKRDGLLEDILKGNKEKKRHSSDYDCRAEYIRSKWRKGVTMVLKGKTNVRNWKAQ
jgi:hypothetical protein